MQTFMSRFLYFVVVYGFLEHRMALEGVEEKSQALNMRSALTIQSID